MEEIKIQSRNHLEAGSEAGESPRILCSTRGKSLICSMIEKRSDTGGQAEGIIADISTKSFTKRPALQEGPLVSIINFMNNAIFVNNKPGNVI